MCGWRAARRRAGPAVAQRCPIPCLTSSFGRHGSCRRSRHPQGTRLRPGQVGLSERSQGCDPRLLVARVARAHHNRWSHTPRSSRERCRCCSGKGQGSLCWPPPGTGCCTASVQLKRCVSPVHIAIWSVRAAALCGDGAGRHHAARANGGRGVARQASCGARRAFANGGAPPSAQA